MILSSEFSQILQNVNRLFTNTPKSGHSFVPGNNAKDVGNPFVADEDEIQDKRGEIRGVE